MIFLIKYVLQDWEKGAGVTQAFKIGKGEKQALLALTSDVPEGVVKTLEHAVKIRGMQRFMNHDVLGRGVFSTGWSSGISGAESWAEPLTNLATDTTLAA